jgi:hypothetical protein
MKEIHGPPFIASVRSKRVSAGTERLPKMVNVVTDAVNLLRGHED